MKKLFLLGAMVCALGMSAKGQSTFVLNPAAQYCVSLGYDYKIVEDSAGAEHGICILPDSSIVDEWSFYRGECKSEFGYCAKKGLSQISIVDSSDGFVTKCAYCVTKDGKGRIAVRDLMIQNGDLEKEQEMSFESASGYYEDSVYTASRSITSTPPTVINFSALPSIENNKSKSFSNADSITLFDNISVCPNPVHSTLFIDGVSVESSIQIHVYSVGGKLIMTNKDRQVDVSSLPNGIYIIKVESDGKTSAIKIIKK